MSWIRYDDEFPAHRKIRRLTDAAFRLHVSAKCWASKYHTDGHIAPEDIDLIGADLDDARDPTTYERATKELVDRGVWHEARHACPRCSQADSGWIIHDYLDYNPSAEQVLAQRAQAAERQRRARGRRRDSGLETIDGATSETSRRDSRVSHPRVTSDVTGVSQPPVPYPSPTPTLSTTEVHSEPASRVSEHPKPRRRNVEPNTEADPQFDRFWSTYPRREAKGAARRAWTKAVGKVDAATLVTAAEKYRDRPDREARYTAHASTWLNNERWTDEHVAVAPSTNGHQPYRDPDDLSRYYGEL